MELLDIVDEQGRPTGQVADRDTVHAQGLRHRTSHVWLARRKQGQVELLLQKRSPEKDSFPDCYDISSAGHIPAGQDFSPSALRELQEELGCTAAPEDLLYCGQRRFTFHEVFHGRPFHDEQVSNVYLLWMDREPEEFVLQPEEVSQVLWVPFDQCLTQIGDGTLPNCIYQEELEMLRKEIEK